MKKQKLSICEIRASKVHNRCEKSQYKNWRQAQDEQYYSCGGRVEEHIGNYEIVLEFEDDNTWNLTAYNEHGECLDGYYGNTKDKVLRNLKFLEMIIQEDIEINEEDSND